jgi:O-methyltransferase involved in polyketide biosynthesis
MDRLRLEPTAALVMRWALKLYDEEAILRFVNQLDLSAGEALLDKCHSVCNWYDKVILNRKSFISYLIEQELCAAKEEYQLVLLAAGKSPLSIEILLRNPSKVYRIFEVDASGMEAKSRLYLKVFPGFSEKLKCVTADIASLDILGILGRPENGYRHDLPTIILLEGISYYLRKQELKNIIASFQSEKEGIFIIEYLVPYRCVDEARRSIPEGVFKIIQEDCGLNSITYYTKKELRGFFREKGGDLISSYSLVDMELMRTGANIYFEKPSDGWIECVVGSVGASQARRKAKPIAKTR